MHPDTLQQVLTRWESLNSTWSTWEPRLRDIAAHMLPQRVRWNTSDASRGGDISDTIINGSPRRAVRTLAAGMMSGVTSPARRWFRLGTADPDLRDFAPVREYLDAVERKLRWLFMRCGFYRAAAMGVFPDISAFGFHASLVEQHPTRMMLITPLPLGEYRLGTNAEGKVDTLYRRLPMTARQVVQQFGEKNVSPDVRAMVTRNAGHNIVEVLHAIQPNADFQPGVLGPRGKAFASLWLELGCAAKHGQYLRVSGYDVQPFVAPRWETRDTTDAYGRGLGDAALNDCRELQHQELSHAELVDKLKDPPMVGDDALRNRRMSLVPGDVTHVPRGAEFKPAVVVPPAALEAVLNKISRLEASVDRTFHADLWRTLLDDERAQRPTATEVTEIKQEAMLQLGPVLENLNAEFLEPYIDHGYRILGNMGFLPDAPAELEGQNLQVEFESVMHQAQKSVALGGIRVFLGEARGVADWKPDVLDNIDGDELIQTLADITGIESDILKSADEVKAIRAARAEKQAQADAIAQAGALAQAGKNLGTTPAPTPETALGSILQAYGPMAAGGFPQGGGVA